MAESLNHMTILDVNPRREKKQIGAQPCLDSLLRMNDQDFGIIVTDNGFVDESSIEIKR
jgi:hypothetical protein